MILDVVSELEDWVKTDDKWGLDDPALAAVIRRAHNELVILRGFARDMCGDKGLEMAAKASEEHGDARLAEVIRGCLFAPVRPAYDSKEGVGANPNAKR